MPRQTSIALLLLLTALPAIAAPASQPAWPRPPADATPLSAGETRDFMRSLARYVEANHLKTVGDQRGMLYEYFDPRHKGQPEQFVEGEALDTMHDGCWYAAAMAAASRATGDPYYRSFLGTWLVPFYCRMLNHSDELFADARNDARPGAVAWDKEHALQFVDGKPERGFVPYWWDDGASVSLDRLRSRNPLADYPCRDRLAGQPNPRFLQNGFALATSNHMAQDVAVMLQQSWLLLKDDPGASGLTGEIAQAVRNHAACVRRHHGTIPMVSAALGTVAGDADVLNRAVAGPPPTVGSSAVANHYTRAFGDFKPGQRVAFPAFADDQEYRYYAGVARAGGRLPESLAFQVVYDAYTQPLAYRYYSDDAPVPPGVNVFDLHPYAAIDGKPADYRSDRRGPGRGPRPVGSRMGPQNMVTSGWALQALRTYPELWEGPARLHQDDLRLFIDDWPPHVRHEPAVPARWTSDAYELRFTSTRDAMTIAGRSTRDELTLSVFASPGAVSPCATITVSRGGATGRGAKGADAPLLLRDVRVEPRDGGGSDFTLTLPYGASKGQAAWFTVIEHARFAVGAGGERRTLYAASDAACVRARLEYELGVGLRTWQTVFAERGFIPTGFGTGRDMDEYSDAGAYAHLITAGAQWVLYLDGTSDWERQRFPAR